MDPRSGVKNDVRLSVFLERHPDRSGGSFVVWKRLRRLFRGWYPRIAVFPSRGRLIKSPSHSFDKLGVDRLTYVA